MAKKTKYYIIPVDKLLNDPSDYRIFDIRDAKLVSMTPAELAVIHSDKHILDEASSLLIPVQ